MKPSPIFSSTTVSAQPFGNRVPKTSTIMTLLFFISLSALIGISECAKKKRSKKTSSSKAEASHQYSTAEFVIPTYVWVLVALTILTVIVVYFYKQHQSQLRQKKLKSIKHAVQIAELGRRSKPCTLTQMQKDEAVANFRTHEWFLEENQKRGQPIKSKLALKSIKRKEQPINQQKRLKDYYDAFEIEMTGHGTGGSFDIYGVIMFEKFYMTIYFEKSLHNNKNSEGVYDYLFFDGAQKKGAFEGKWFPSDDTIVDEEMVQTQKAIKQQQEKERLERTIKIKEQLGALAEVKEILQKEKELSNGDLEAESASNNHLQRSNSMRSVGDGTINNRSFTSGGGTFRMYYQTAGGKR